APGMTDRAAGWCGARAPGIHTGMRIDTPAIVIFLACIRPLASPRQTTGPASRRDRSFPHPGQDPRPNERSRQASAPQPAVVRPRRQAGFLLPQLAQGPGPAARDVRRPAGDRDLQYLVGADA